MELPLSIDQASVVALHRQVYDAIRSAILHGRLRAGDRLPATRVLAGQLSLSRTTVAEAYDQLQAEGYIQGKHGSGTYVAPDLPEETLQVTAGDGEQGTPARRPVRLSQWGERIVARDYQALFRPPSLDEFRYDFRPHRVAQDLFPWDAWRGAAERALSSDRTRLLLYPPSAGHPELRELVAAHIRRYRAVTCSTDQIVIVNGIQQGLNLLVHLLLEPGDRVAVEDPGYPTARLAFEARGLTVTQVPVDRDGLMVERLAGLPAHRLVHVTPSHQDPTGATLSLARRLALLELAERTECLILEDDYDSEFRYEGRPVESLQGLDRNGLVVYGGTFSKSVLAGLRIGFLVLPPDLVSPFVAAKSLWDSGAPMLEQAILAEFMRSGDFERHIRRMRRLYRDRRNALLTALQTCFGDRVEFGARHGGLNVLIALDLPCSEAELAMMAAGGGIALRPASPYYAVEPARPHFLMGFASLPEEEIAQGVRKLAAMLHQNKMPPPRTLGSAYMAGAVTRDKEVT